MSFSKTRHFFPKIFEAGLLAKVVENIIGDKPKHVDITDFQDLPDGGNVSHSLNSPFGLATICDISEHRVTVFYRTSSDKRQYFFMKMACGLIEVDVGADTPDDMQAVLDLLTKGLDLKEASEEARAKERGPSRRELSERLAVLERIILGPNRTLRCFLSYRFTPENEDPARKLHSFLILLGIDVVTGNTYEPRPVSQKIMGRLKDDLDFIVLLAGGDGESFWTRDEIATAKHKMIPLVPVIEDGVKFEPGLFGDIECVPYKKGHIGDSFLKVLEAVKYIREQHKAISSPSPELQ